MLVAICGATACTGKSPLNPTDPSSGGLQVSVIPPTLFAGDTGSAVAPTQDGGQASWQSSDPSVATVASGGIVRAIGPGVAVLTATYHGMSGSSLVTVLNSSNVVFLTIACGTAPSIFPTNQTQALSVLVGQSIAPCFARAFAGSGQSAYVHAAWSSADPAIATVGPTAFSDPAITGASAGQTIVSASFGGQSSTIQVTAKAEDYLRMGSGFSDGGFHVGDNLTLGVGGDASVASASQGTLTIRVADQNDTTVAATTITEPRGFNTFSVRVSFVVPANATRLCSSAVLQVGSVRLEDKGSSGFCFTVLR